MGGLPTGAEPLQPPTAVGNLPSAACALLKPCQARRAKSREILPGYGWAAGNCWECANPAEALGSPEAPG